MKKNICMNNNSPKNTLIRQLGLPFLFSVACVIVVLFVLTLRSFIQNRDVIRQTPFVLVNKTTELLTEKITNIEEQVSFVGSYLSVAKIDERDTYAKSFLINQGSFLGIELVDNLGAVQYEAHNSLFETNTDNANQLRSIITEQAIKTKKTIIVDPIMSEIGYEYITLATPVISTNGEIAHITIAYIDAGSLWGIIPSLKQTNNEHIIVASSTLDILASSEILSKTEKEALKSFEVSTKIKNNKGKIFNLNYDDTKYLASSNTIGSTSWFVIGMVNTKTLFTSFTNNFLVGLTCLSLLLTIFIYEIMIIRKVLIKPLNTIIGGLSSIEKGDFKIQVEGSSTVEFQRIASMFNKMTESLYSSYSMLEYKVAEKTQELTSTLSKIEVLNKQLLRQKANDDALISSLGDIMCVIDKQGAVVRSNKKFNELFNGMENPLYKEVFGISKTDDVEFSFEKVLSSQNKYTYYSLEYPLVLDGKNNQISINIALSCAPIFALGEYLGAVLLMTDITEEAQTEKKKGEFFMFASHQLRTPMTAIRWASEALLSKQIEPEVKEQISLIQTTNQGMIDMVNMLLNVSKLELGVLTPIIMPTNLVAVRDNVLQEFKAMMNEKKIFLQVSNNNQVTVKTDEKLLKMVLQNLIANAVKYSPLGGTIEIIINDDIDQVKLMVKDDGPGIPPEDKDHIFEKFYRAANVKNSYTGNGLGLYMSKQIADAMGHDVVFENKLPGQLGVIFTVSFKK